MELVNVHTAAGELDAELVKSLLDSEGIPAMISAESYGRLLGGLWGSSAFGQVKVLVRPEDAERARAILADVRIEVDMPEEEYDDG